MTDKIWIAQTYVYDSYSFGGFTEGPIYLFRTEDGAKARIERHGYNLVEYADSVKDVSLDWEELRD